MRDFLNVAFGNALRLQYFSDVSCPVIESSSLDFGSQSGFSSDTLFSDQFFVSSSELSTSTELSTGSTRPKVVTHTDVHVMDPGDTFLNDVPNLSLQDEVKPQPHAEDEDAVEVLLLQSP